MENQGISRRIVGKENRYPKRTPQKEANSMETSSSSGMNYYLLEMFHNIIRIG